VLVRGRGVHGVFIRRSLCDLVARTCQSKTSKIGLVARSCQSKTIKLDSGGSRRTVGTHGSVILAGFVGVRCIGSRRVPGATRHMLPSQNRPATALRIHPPTPPPATKRPFDHIKPQNNNSTDLEPGSVVHPHRPGATRAPGSGEPVRGRVERKRPRRIDEVPNRLTGRGWSGVGGEDGTL
jgi:hypothetical protein